MLIEIQPLTQNLDTSAYTIKGAKEYINPSYIKRLSPFKEGYALRMIGDEPNATPTVIDEASFKKLIEHKGDSNGKDKKGHS